MDEDNNSQPNEEEFGIAFWVMLAAGIVGFIGFVFVAGGAAFGG